MSYKYFTEAELTCKCGTCGRQDMKPDFMAKIERLRENLGFPFIVTSAFRCPEHNNRVSSSGYSGPHTTGRAIDIAVSGTSAFLLLQAAANSCEFTGFGIQQKGTGRFIHLDDILTGTRPWVWSY